MSRGQYGRGYQEGKKAAENLIKDEKAKKVVTSAIAAALAFVGGLIVKGLGNK